MRPSVCVLVSLLAFPLAACGGDDTINPTNPDASSASAKPADAAADGSKDGHAEEASAEAGEPKEAGEAGDGEKPGPAGAEAGGDAVALPDSSDGGGSGGASGDT